MAIPTRKIIKAQLIELLSSNGAMNTLDVYTELAKLWSLTADELSAKRSGGSLYQNEIRWARQELAFEGIIARPMESSRGVWALKNLLSKQDVNHQDELDAEQEYPEGAASKVLVNTYERNPEARKACLTFHGYICKACQVSLEDIYGPIGKEKIHVHHLVEISSIGSDYKIVPTTELVPLCPNCHFMAHQRRPPFTVKELQAMMQSNKKSQANSKG